MIGEKIVVMINFAELREISLRAKPEVSPTGGRVSRSSLLRLISREVKLRRAQRNFAALNETSLELSEISALRASELICVVVW